MDRRKASDALYILSLVLKLVAKSFARKFQQLALDARTDFSTASCVNDYEAKFKGFLV